VFFIVIHETDPRKKASIRNGSVAIPEGKQKALECLTPALTTECPGSEVTQRTSDHNLLCKTSTMGSAKHKGARNVIFTK
jgi:hypothetical protein